MSSIAMWVLGLVATLGVVAVGIALGRRMTANPDLGDVSNSWLQEHRTKADDPNR